MEAAVAILAGVVTALIWAVNYLWARLRLLEQMAAGLSPTHAVEAVARKVDRLEGQMGEGFSKAAEVMSNLNAAIMLTNTAVKLHAAAAEENYVRKGEVN